MILAKWTYTTDEWKTFLRSTHRKKNRLIRLIRSMFVARVQDAPQVFITPEKISIGNDQQYFNSSRHELHTIDLRNEGSVNILSITFSRSGTTSEIKVPVPKGKLREAIQVQEMLNTGR